MDKEEISPQAVSSAEYYSLLELIEKLGKEGVAALVAKGKPRKISKGDMIYFLKSDVHKIMGEDFLEEEAIENEEVEDGDDAIEDESADLIIESPSEISSDFIPIRHLVFKETLLKRHKIENDEVIFSDKILDLSHDVIYGRSKGDPERQKAFQDFGIISSLHGRLFLDDDNNLLYENLGANKSKVRGCKDKNYTALEVNEIAVLIPREILEDLYRHRIQEVSASIKLGYQRKPHFIVRITVHKV